MPSASSRGRDVVEEARARAGATSSRVRSASSASCSRVVRPSAERDRQARALPALQPGDAHHVELVEVAGEDRQELHPLQQRLRVVLGQREHPGVEVQPGQLAVEETIGRQRRSARLGRHRVIGAARRCPARNCRARPDAEGQCRHGRSASVSTSGARPGQSRPGRPRRWRGAPGPTRRRSADAAARRGRPAASCPCRGRRRRSTGAAARAAASAPGQLGRAQRRQVGGERGDRRAGGQPGAVLEGRVQAGVGLVGDGAGAERPDDVRGHAGRR